MIFPALMRSTYQPLTGTLPRPVQRRGQAPVVGGFDNFLRPLVERSATSSRLQCREIGEFYHGTQRFFIPRLIFRGPPGGGDLVRLGVFASIHGDEPEGAFALRELLLELDRQPELAMGYELVVYPVCNPSGFEDHTRRSRAGRDLNREFWRGSKQPEVYFLERELGVMEFDGLISLHSDDTAEGVYAYVRGATLTEALAKAALAAAGEFLPVAAGELIDGFPATSGLIRERCYDGVLSDPTELRPPPFEIIFETPQHAPRALQVAATRAALRAVLAEYRALLAYGQNL
ncbi:hypothetical protein AYO41_01235 [Verrucomicrobia bacterium SCGC AG-212-E04]|nr:hypothetical protein AYO41_01235 [Verrucomicrobia bacterium SCGC AG-212-E04]